MFLIAWQWQKADFVKESRNIQEKTGNFSAIFKTKPDETSVYLPTNCWNIFIRCPRIFTHIQHKILWPNGEIVWVRNKSLRNKSNWFRFVAQIFENHRGPNENPYLFEINLTLPSEGCAITTTKPKESLKNIFLH